jgi:MFS family permease
VGLLASAFALSFVPLQVPLGFLADRYGPKPFLAGGYGLACAAGLLYTFAGGTSAILLGRVLQGAGEASLWALAPVTLAALYPRNRGRVMGVYNASLQLGLAAGGLASLLFDGGRILPYLLYALTGLLASLGILLGTGNRVAPREGEGEKAAAPGDWRRIPEAVRALKAPSVLLGIALYGTGYAALVTVIPSMLQRAGGGTAGGGMGAYFTLFYLAVGVSQVVAGGISDRRGRWPAMTGGLLLAAAGFGAFPLLRGSWSILLCLPAGFGLGTFCVAAMALLNERAPESLRGSISGVFYAFWGVGYFLGPPLLGRLGDWAGSFSVFRASSALFFLAALLLLKEGSARNR